MADSSPGNFAQVLRLMRRRRMQSQLQLANLSGVSQRQISFLESGRAQPTRETIEKIATALGCGAGESDGLLRSAGFLQHWPQAMPAVPTPELRQLIDSHLSAAPHPAIVCDPLGNILFTNAIYRAVMTSLQRQGMRWTFYETKVTTNLYRLSFSESGLAPFLENLQELAPIAKRNALIDSAFHPECVALFDALERENPGLNFNACAESEAGPVAEHYRIGGRLIRVFVLASHAARSHVYAEQIQFYSFIPVDDASRDFFAEVHRH